MDKSGVHDQIDNVKNSTATLADRGASMAHQAIDKSVGFANQVADKGTDFANQAAAKGAQVKKAIVDTGAKAIKTSGSFIRENPHSTVLSSFAFGALLGAGIAFLIMENRN